MDIDLFVFLSTEDTINSDQISNSICSSKLARKLLHISLLPADTHYCFALQWTNCFLLWPKYFWFWVYSSCCHFSAAIVSMFLCIVGLLGLVSMSEMWLFGSESFMKTTTGLTFPDSRRMVPLVSVKSELMALLDIFQLWREMSLMYFTSAALSFINWPLLS